MSNLRCGLLPPPPKVNSGYIFTTVSPSVRLFVCLEARSLKTLWTDSDVTWWSGWLCDNDYGEDLDLDLDKRTI